jgi:hypothetical protein
MAHPWDLEDDDAEKATDTVNGTDSVNEGAEDYDRGQSSQAAVETNMQDTGCRCNTM